MEKSDGFESLKIENVLLVLKTDSMFSDFATKCLQALWLPISNADSERYLSSFIHLATRQNGHKLQPKLSQIACSPPSGSDKKKEFGANLFAEKRSYSGCVESVTVSLWSMPEQKVVLACRLTNTHPKTGCQWKSPNQLLIATINLTNRYGLKLPPLVHPAENRTAISTVLRSLTQHGSCVSVNFVVQYNNCVGSELIECGSILSGCTVEQPSPYSSAPRRFMTNNCTYMNLMRIAQDARITWVTVHFWEKYPLTPKGTRARDPPKLVVSCVDDYTLGQPQDEQPRIWGEGRVNARFITPRMNIPSSGGRGGGRIPVFMTSSQRRAWPSDVSVPLVEMDLN
uniref:Uncharacterized protein n=1 Tax=Timema shepardi TaxID=629360 RepID=A0A7R9B3S3_TIMSH|nr:unnamed protein product [Timema shepardi]